MRFSSIRFKIYMRSLSHHIGCDPVLVVKTPHTTIKGGKVFVQVRKEYARALVFITDTGAGIPEEDLTMIFNRSFHMESRPQTVEQELDSY